MFRFIFEQKCVKNNVCIIFPVIKISTKIIQGGNIICRTKALNYNHRILYILCNTDIFICCLFLFAPIKSIRKYDEHFSFFHRILCTSDRYILN